MPEQHNNNPAPSQFADSGPPSHVNLPDVGIRKKPVSRMADFDFEELWRSGKWQEDSKSLISLMKKLEARLKEDGHNLPDRLDIRLTTELDSGDRVVGLRLFVNGKEVRQGGVICPFELLRSTYRNERFYIHSCTCHSPECAGIWGGTLVADIGDWMFWETNDKVVNHVFLFDPVEYRREIFHACRRAVRKLQNNPDLLLEMEVVDRNVLAQSLTIARRRAQRRITCDGSLRLVLFSALRRHFKDQETSES